MERHRVAGRGGRRPASPWHFQNLYLMSRENDAAPNWRDRLHIACLAGARLELPSVIAMFDSNNRQP